MLGLGYTLWARRWRSNPWCPCTTLKRCVSLKIGVAERHRRPIAECWPSGYNSRRMVIKPSYCVPATERHNVLNLGDPLPLKYLWEHFEVTKYGKCALWWAWGISCFVLGFLNWLGMSSSRDHVDQQDRFPWVSYWDIEITECLFTNLRCAVWNMKPLKKCIRLDISETRKGTMASPESVTFIRKIGVFSQNVWKCLPYIDWMPEKLAAGIDAHLWSRNCSISSFCSASSFLRVLSWTLSLQMKAT